MQSTQEVHRSGFRGGPVGNRAFSQAQNLSFIPRNPTLEGENQHFPLPASCPLTHTCVLETCLQQISVIKSSELGDDPPIDFTA